MMSKKSLPPFSRFQYIIASLFLLVCAWGMAWAETRLPAFFSDHMVFQQKTQAAVWGWAAAGEEIVVQASWGAEASTRTGADGKWMLKIATPAAGGPYTLMVNSIVLRDVLVGEVWLCSGQSNMQWTVQASANANAEIAAATYPNIRHFETPRIAQNQAVADVKAVWQVCSPETVASFSAVAYFFARHLHQELGVPIGLINSSWGGTRIEPWIPLAGYARVPELEQLYAHARLADPGSREHQEQRQAYLAAVERWLAQTRASAKEGALFSPPPQHPKGLLPIMDQVGGHDPQQATVLFNGLIAPFVGYSMRGAIWYQGESNLFDGMLYAKKKRALLEGWRELWGIGDFPFYYVQIAPFQYGDSDPEILARLWEGQAAALEIPNTEMAVIHDIGDLTDIHPPNKQDVGRRLARIALARDYGKNLVYSGPTFKSMTLEGPKIRIAFDHVGSGLAARDGKALTWFEIIGKDTAFVPADAVIDGDMVVLSSLKVKEAYAVRFGWHKLAEPNLINRDGLPARPFRAGKVPKRDGLAPEIPEAKEYQLLYELDLTKLGSQIQYDLDNSDTIAGTPSRIAYYLELQSGGGTQYVYVSMDAFTSDLKKMGIPTAASGAMFQQAVNKMTIVSNVEGLKAGEGIAGNIEFWPHNYIPTNSARVQGASNDVYDIGDSPVDPVDPVDGYGSMQVHHTAAGQTVFAINKWREGGTADIGIGNSSGEHKDWTFSSSGANYTFKLLRVLVRTE